MHAQERVRPCSLRPLNESTAHAGYVRGIVYATLALLQRDGGSSATRRVRPTAAASRSAIRLPRDSGHAPGITLAYTLQPNGMRLCQCATVRLGRRCPLPGAWRCCELIHGARPFPGQIPAEWGYSHRRSTAAAPAGPSTLARHSRQDQSSPGDGYTHAGCVSVHTPLRVSG